MPVYLSQFSYTAEAWTSMISHPQDRSEAIRELLQRMGGRLIGFFGALGEHDAISIFELPDDVTAATFIGAAITSGHLRETHTTTLINAAGFLSPPEHSQTGQTGYYLLQTGYTSEAWATMVGNPQNRLEAVQPVAERLGGSLEDAWLSFGEYDVVVLLRMPDLTSAAAFGRVLAAGGAIKATKITPLLTPEESLAVLHKAAGAGYQPPPPGD